MKDISRKMDYRQRKYESVSLDHLQQERHLEPTIWNKAEKNIKTMRATFECNIQ